MNGETKVIRFKDEVIFSRFNRFRGEHFFRETYPSETISRVLISGGTSHMLGLADRIQSTFSYPTEVLDPFRNIDLGAKVDISKLASLGPALTVAVGLALRGFDQRLRSI